MIDCENVYIFFKFIFSVVSMSLSSYLLLLKYHVESVCSVSYSCCLCVESRVERTIASS